MSTDPTESKEQSETGNNEEISEERKRTNILLGLDSTLNTIQICDTKVAPMEAFVMFGELHDLAFKCNLIIGEAAQLFNPIVILRKHYKTQNWAKASYFYNQVSIKHYRTLILYFPEISHFRLCLLMTMLSIVFIV